MSWRTIVITKHSKLEYKIGYLVYRSDITKKIHLSEISTVIIESTQVSLTSSLLCELIKNKINVIFCDEKHNPQSQLNALYGRYDTPRKIKEQINWDKSMLKKLWKDVITQKILNQAKTLKRFNKDNYDLLSSYIPDIQPGDKTNREGHAAKVYFNSLFGLSFKRDDNCSINSALDYGYTILLSCFNRTIISMGYLTQLGIFHRGEENQFNLSCDLMEPFRALVDWKVYIHCQNQFDVLEKRILQDILNDTITINDMETTVQNAITIYCKSVFDALNKNDINLVKYYEL